MRLLLVAVLCAAFALPGCRTAKIAADVAQAAFEPYSLEVSGPHVHGNARFIAIEAGGAGAIVVRGPEVYGGPIVVLKTFQFEATTERRVWAIQFSADRSKPVSLVPATWEQARVSMPHLAP